jgi:hypothetical protein
MEFSSAYAIAPVGTSLIKTAYYSWATFYRADGSVLEGAGSTRGRSVIARALLTGRKSSNAPDASHVIPASRCARPGCSTETATAYQ